jgi:hypothetical protein
VLQSPRPVNIAQRFSESSPVENAAAAPRRVDYRHFNLIGKNVRQ